MAAEEARQVSRQVVCRRGAAETRQERSVVTESRGAQSPRQERMSEKSTGRQVHLDSKFQVRLRLICKRRQYEQSVGQKNSCPAWFWKWQMLIDWDGARWEGTPGGLSGSALPARNTAVYLPPDAGDASSLLYITAVSTLQLLSRKSLLLTSHPQTCWDVTFSGNCHNHSLCILPGASNVTHPWQHGFRDDKLWPDIRCCRRGISSIPLVLRTQSTIFTIFWS